MSGIDVSGGVGHSAFGPEVFVVDTDVLLGDACGVLAASGKRSELLRAIDAGTAIAVMSEQAFHELGWMSAVAARGRGVDHDDLRALIGDAYLPRIPIVVTPALDAAHAMDDACDIVDPDDVAHVQVARFISARAVYSHDKHLRRPGIAPATRADYDRRIEHLGVLSTRSEVERGVAFASGLTCAGTAGAVSWAAERMGVTSVIVWSGLGLAVAVAAHGVLTPPERRQRIGAWLGPVIAQVGSAIERSDIARRELRLSRLVTSPNMHRLEVRVATYLVGHPASTMNTIAEDLDLSSTERQQLSALLRSHPTFELVSRWGWAVGRIRGELETQPSSSWRPRLSEHESHKVTPAEVDPYS